MVGIKILSREEITVNIVLVKNQPRNRNYFNT